MKKIKILFLLTLLPLFSYAQFIGFAGQYSQGADGQFVANMSFPTYHEENSLRTFISSGLEFTTSGGARLAGLNIKPIQAQTYFSEDFYNNNPVTLLLGVDAGYLFDFRSRRKNSIVITPNLHCEWKVFFVKTGYDIDTFHGNSQFFVRAGIGIGLGTFKMFAPTKIR
ncbi:MAG: hypothetical protein E6772_11480 [Dysgonomonas sp.]|nr:hypothetical protein [Dysgonomonas sp.]